VRDSTFTTSAPWSASGLVRNGPAPTQLKSATRIPVSGSCAPMPGSFLVGTNVGRGEAVRRARQRDAPPLDLDDAEVVARDQLGSCSRSSGVATGATLMRRF
jgi:hypothetical protein